MFANLNVYIMLFYFSVLKAESGILIKYTFCQNQRISPHGPLPNKKKNLVFLHSIVHALYMGNKPFKPCIHGSDRATQHSSEALAHNNIKSFSRVADSAFSVYQLNPLVVLGYS